MKIVRALDIGWRVVLSTMQLVSIAKVYETFQSSYVLTIDSVVFKRCGCIKRPVVLYNQLAHCPCCQATFLRWMPIIE